MLFIMNVSGFFIGSSMKIALNLLILVSYSAVLMIPQSRWTRMRLTAAVMIIGLETAAGMLVFGEIQLIYMLAILLLAVTIRLSLAKSSFPAVIVMLVMTLLYIKLGKEDLFSILSFVLLAAVLYMNIRSRMQRNEIHEQNKRHLAELQEAYDQLQDANQAVMRYAVLEERTRISREIHDAVGHSLTSLIVQMQALRYMLRHDPVQAEQSIDGMLAVARQGLKDIRTAVHSLADEETATGISSMHGLLSRMEASASIAYTLQENSGDCDIPDEVYVVLFRVLQEAISNIIRHSGASLVEVELNGSENHVVMRIRDNGKVSSDNDIREGFGLNTMKARIEGKGGRLRIAAASPHGCEIVADIPYGEETTTHAK
jgi:signal transduction histidine kinase